MELNEAILKRRSRRSYLTKEVEEEKIEKILFAGMHAPIANGKYDNLVIKVYKGEKLKNIQNKLLKLIGNDNFYNAPLAIFIYHKGNNVDLANLDSGAVIENMLLEATSLDLGSLFIYSFVRISKAREELKEYFSFNRGEDEFILRSVVSIGYIDDLSLHEVPHKIEVIKEY